VQTTLSHSSATNPTPIFCQHFSQFFLQKICSQFSANYIAHFFSINIAPDPCSNNNAILIFPVPQTERSDGGGEGSHPDNDDTKLQLTGEAADALNSASKTGTNRPQRTTTITINNSLKGQFTNILVTYLAYINTAGINDNGQVTPQKNEKEKYTNKYNHFHAKITREQLSNLLSNHDYYPFDLSQQNVLPDRGAIGVQEGLGNAPTTTMTAPGNNPLSVMPKTYFEAYVSQLYIIPIIHILTIGIYLNKKYHKRSLGIDSDVLNNTIRQNANFNHHNNGKKAKKRTIKPYDLANRSLVRANCSTVTNDNPYVSKSYSHFQMFLAHHSPSRDRNQHDAERRLQGGHQLDKDLHLHNCATNDFERSGAASLTFVSRQTMINVIITKFSLTCKTNDTYGCKIYIQTIAFQCCSTKKQASPEYKYLLTKPETTSGQQAVKQKVMNTCTNVKTLHLDLAEKPDLRAYKTFLVMDKYVCCCKPKRRCNFSCKHFLWCSRKIKLEMDVLYKLFTLSTKRALKPGANIMNTVHCEFLKWAQEWMFLVCTTKANTHNSNIASLQRPLTIIHYVATIYQSVLYLHDNG
jgi:hypothetical protein